jgi:purine-nucleoside phosphorylase
VITCKINYVRCYDSFKAATVSVLTDECDPDHLEPVNIEDIIAMAHKAEPDIITIFKELIESL